MSESDFDSMLQSSKTYAKIFSFLREEHGMPIPSYPPGERFELFRGFMEQLVKRVARGAYSEALQHLCERAARNRKDDVTFPRFRADIETAGVGLIEVGPFHSGRRFCRP